MNCAPLLLGPAQTQALEKLREIARANPVDMKTLMERLETPEGKRAHRGQMTAQTIEVPFGYFVTYSIEINHPGGTMAHMSMSCRPGRVPSPQAVWLVCERLGFRGGITLCTVWLEDLERPNGRHEAVNVVQSLEPPA